MKLIKCLPIGLFLLLIACNIPTLILYDVGPFELAVFRQGLNPSQYKYLEQLNTANRYVIDLKIAEDMCNIEGSQDLRYTNNEDTPLSEVIFHLYPNLLGGEMHIAAVTVGGSAVIPAFDETQGLMHVPLTEPLQPGRSIIIGIDFSVVVPTSSGVNFGSLVYNSRILSLAYAYPIVSVYDTEGWDTTTPSQYGDLLYADASFYRVTVEAPAELVLVASGIETYNESFNGRRRTVFLNGPARDFYLAASPDFIDLDRKIGQVTIHSYAIQGRSQAAQEALDIAEKALHAYTNRYGSYPYTELDIVPIPLSALGMEFPGTVGIDLDLYPIDGSAASDFYFEFTIAHEIAHQWFYNLVGNDQMNEPWLDESLVQFGVIKYFEDTDPVKMQAFEAHLEENLLWLGGRSVPVGSPVSAYSADTYLSVIYNTGPLVLQRLEELVGPDVFNVFLYDYAQSLSWKMSSTQSFKTLAELHCSCDLTPFFDEWIYP